MNYSNAQLLLPTAKTALKRRLVEFISNPDFPCVGAKSALNSRGLYSVTARSICSAWNDVAIHQAIARFGQLYNEDTTKFYSLAILFEHPATLSEKQFEEQLWCRIQSWTDKDVWLGFEHDCSVRQDPDHKEFSLSFGGNAFFAVGLHPKSSRKARRFERPAIILNLHKQFETLRASGKYLGMKKAILSRDKKLQGSTNPMLTQFGSTSEACQYSGRFVEPVWKCPYQRAESETSI